MTCVAGEGLLAALDIEPVRADRPLGPDIERLAAGDWLPVVEAISSGRAIGWRAMSVERDIPDETA